MKYIKMVIDNVEEKVTQQSLSTVEILTHTLKLLKTGISFWVIVAIVEIYNNNWRRKWKIQHQTRQLYCIFLNTYQNDQILVSALLKMVWHVMSATN